MSGLVENAPFLLCDKCCESEFYYSIMGEN